MSDWDTIYTCDHCEAEYQTLVELKCHEEGCQGFWRRWGATPLIIPALALCFAYHFWIELERAKPKRFHSMDSCMSEALKRKGSCSLDLSNGEAIFRP